MRKRDQGGNVEDMSFRDHVAARCCQSMMIGFNTIEGWDELQQLSDNAPEYIAEKAYEIADAMIKVRNATVFED